MVLGGSSFPALVSTNAASRSQDVDTYKSSNMNGGAGKDASSVTSMVGTALLNLQSRGAQRSSVAGSLQNLPSLCCLLSDAILGEMKRMTLLKCASGAFASSPQQDSTRAIWSPNGNHASSYLVVMLNLQHQISGI